jgi:predicted Zn-dependent protease
VGEPAGASLTRGVGVRKGSRVDRGAVRTSIALQSSVALRASVALRLLGAALVTLTASGCISWRSVQEPPLPKAERRPRVTVLATEADDRRAGQEAERQAIADLGLIRDDTVRDYVQAVGMRLVAHARQRDFDYRFQVVDSWTPNAFALPGGAIFVSRGLVALTDSEDELAGVLAHEIMHVAARHAAAQQWVRQTIPFAFGWYGAGQIAAYARDQERVADEGGQRIAAAAGYDPMALTEMLRSLEQEERLQLGASRLPSFLQSHPSNVERMADVATRGQAMRWTPEPGVAGGVEGHLRRLAGMVVGDDPAEGVFQGNRFVHPDLGFAVSFPEGWKLVNTSRMVAAFSPAGDARFALESAGPGDDPRIAAGGFLAGEARRLHASVTAAESLEVGGLPAYQLRAHMLAPQGPVEAQLTWIAFGGSVYRLSAMTAPPAAARYFGRAQAMARSFRPATEDERAEVHVERLALARVRPGEDLETLGRRAEDAWDATRTAVLNGIQPGAPVAAGRLLKVVISEPYRGSPPPAPAPTGRAGPPRAPRRPSVPRGS